VLLFSHDLFFFLKRLLNIYLNKKMNSSVKQKNGIISAILNGLIPGAGYFYCGSKGLGIIAFIVGGGIILTTLGFGWLVVMPVMLIDGFFAAGRANKKLTSEQPSSSNVPDQTPENQTLSNHMSDQSESLPQSEQDWIMKAKPTPYWKFLLGANPIKSYQLDAVEKKGDCIVVTVQSGKQGTFRIGEFKGKYIKTKQGLRDFTFKSTVGPKQKIVFREVLMQMPEEWWNELASKLGTSESGLSKALSAVSENT
jgi:TM2 domain-containing membrane protein YozV